MKLYRLIVAAAVLAPASHGGTTYTFLTDFRKDNNIYTNLNQQYPNTGPGVPGSGVGTPNATFLYDPATFSPPGLVAGSDLANNGVEFELTSNSAGQDFASLTRFSIDQETVTSDIAGATAVYLLTTASGFTGGEPLNVTFTGDGGATESFGQINVPDFCVGGQINTASAVNGSLTDNQFSQTVLQVLDGGACATGNSATGKAAAYVLTEQIFLLSPAFAGQNLVSTVITSDGSGLLILGETVAGSGSSSTPEPATGFLAFGALIISSLLIKRRTITAQPSGGRDVRRIFRRHRAS